MPVTADGATADAFAAAAADDPRQARPRRPRRGNSGVMLAAPFESADTDEWDRMIDTNVSGLLRTSRAFIDDLIAIAAEGDKPADLVLVGSIGGHERFPKYAVYTSTKAAVAHLTRELRAEFGPRGVRVKNVEPGFVGTELGDHMSDEEATAQLGEWRDSMEILVPDDIAAAVAFSVSSPSG